MKSQMLFSKLIVIAITALALNQIACSKSKFGSTGGTQLEQNDLGFGDEGLTDGADLIQFNDNGTVITWSSGSNNLYAYDSEGCVRGILRYAGDKQAEEKVQELFSLINTSVVSNGENSSGSSDSTTLSIRYDDSEVKRFNLRSDLASSAHRVLSNGSRLINFFEEVSDMINLYGVRNCNNGKK